jgi:hypothetical protein
VQHKSAVKMNSKAKKKKTKSSMRGQTTPEKNLRMNKKNTTGKTSSRCWQRHFEEKKSDKVQQMSRSRSLSNASFLSDFQSFMEEVDQIRERGELFPCEISSRVQNFLIFCKQTPRWADFIRRAGGT